MCCPTCIHTSLVAQVSSVCLHVHPWSSACALVLEFSLHPSLYFFLKSFFRLFLVFNLVPDENSMEDPLCNSSFGSMVSLDYVTPDTGYEPKDMDLADTNERNLATSSDIYFQNTLEDTASFPNPDIDDDELAEFLAVVVDRTGQPVEVRSNSDQFSCDIRNVKSAQSQFPLVTQPKRMINQTGGSDEERIAEERASSNSEEQLSLNMVRKFFITNSKQLMPKKNAEFYEKNYGVSKRIFVKFINNVLLRWRNYENSRVLPSIRSQEGSSSRIRTLLWNYQEDYKNYKMK